MHDSCARILAHLAATIDSAADTPETQWCPSHLFDYNISKKSGVRITNPSSIRYSNERTAFTKTLQFLQALASVYAQS